MKGAAGGTSDIKFLGDFHQAKATGVRMHNLPAPDSKSCQMVTFEHGPPETQGSTRWRKCYSILFFSIGKWPTPQKDCIS